jgi:PGF-CTERM protein
MSYSTKRSIAVVLVALMLVVVPASATATTPARLDAVPEESPVTVAQVAVNNSTDVDPADTVYLTEDGDAVLAYRETLNESTRMELGMNMSEGLVHMLVTDELESEVTGTASAALGPEEFVSNGSMTAPKPDQLRSLDASAKVTRTSSKATSSMRLEAVVEPEESTTTQTGTVSTEGQVRSSASSFDFSGSATVSDVPSLAAMGPMAHSVSITETDTGYTVDVTQDYEVSYYARQQWDSRENATRTLETQYGVLAAQLGGDSEVTIDAYDFSEAGENTYRLDIEYTIEYRNVHEAVTQQLTQGLANAENFTLSQSEARAVSERIQKLEVEGISGSVSVEDTMTADWDVQLENFDEVALALLDVADSAKEMPESTQEQLDRARKQLEASQEAGVVQTASWQGEFAADDDGTVTVDFQTESRTENWAAYVSALEERGIDTTTYQLEMTATTTDGTVTADLAVTMADEDLLAGMFASGTTGSDAPPELTEAVETFRQADFERAKMDISAQDGQIRVEAGAKFANASAFGDVMQETYGHTVRSVVSQPADGSQVTYVRVEGLTDEDPTKSAVRDMGIADEDTTIELPGEWDRDFPTMGATSAVEFLGYDPASDSSDGGSSGDDGSDGDSSDSESSPDDGGDGTTADDGGGSGSSGGMPGFGAGLALVALLAGLVMLSRRRTE